MRKSLYLAAWVILAGFVMGAAAPKKTAEKPTSQPNSKPRVSEVLQAMGIDIKAKPTEAQVQSALDKAGVKVVERKQSEANREMMFWILDNGIDLGFSGGILMQAGRKTPPQKPPTSQPTK